MFEEFKQNFGKLYHTQEQHEYRFQVFSNNSLKIQKHNADGQHTFTMGMNKFGDLTHEEFKQTLRGYDTTVLQRSGKPYMNYSHITASLHQKGLLSSPHSKLPASIDWAAQGKMTRVKDQQYCGGCWAFAVVDALEARFAIANKAAPVELSVQQQLDCNHDGVNDGCIGGNLPEGYTYIINNHGLCLAKDYKFQGQDSSKKCRKRMRRCSEKSGKMRDYRIVHPNDEKALQAAVAEGPVSIAIEADDEKLQFYEKGIFNSNNCGTSVDHAMTIVGYGEQNGSKFWKIKGTWSPDWGEKGYIRVCRECNKNGRTGECGVTVEPVYPVI